jgi:hypothetical protein
VIKTFLGNISVALTGQRHIESWTNHRTDADPQRFRSQNQQPAEENPQGFRSQNQQPVEENPQGFRSQKQHPAEETQRGFRSQKQQPVDENHRGFRLWNRRADASLGSRLPWTTWSESGRVL